VPVAEYVRFDLNGVPDSRFRREPTPIDFGIDGFDRDA
jgi:hypothetical protein